LKRQIADPATAPRTRFKMSSELHSRYSLPFASLVFAVIAVPLGIQNRRSGKSAGFSVSIFLLLMYYLLLSLMKTIAEKGGIPIALALWLPNLIFMAIGWYLLRLASLERRIPFPSPEYIVGLLKWRAR